MEIPEEIHFDEGLELGITEGVMGGVAGGVPGGVVGAIVGGLSEPRESRKPVRVGGSLQAPKLIHRVPLQYPLIALQARLQSVVILEALVDVDGRVRSVKVLRGHPLLDAAAVEAVRQWRYLPLLLNGEPTRFVLTVTVAFRLTGPQHRAPALPRPGKSGGTP